MSFTVAQYLDRFLSSTVVGLILCVSGVVGMEVKTSLTGDDISPSVVSCNGSATVFSSVITTGVGNSVPFVFIIVSFFVCSSVLLVLVILISVKGGEDLSFCSSWVGCVGLGTRLKG